MRAALALLISILVAGAARAEDRLPVIIYGPGAQTPKPDEAQAAYERGRREQAEQDRKAAEQPAPAAPGVVYGGTSGGVVGGVVIETEPRRPIGPANRVSQRAKGSPARSAPRSSAVD